MPLRLAVPPGLVAACLSLALGALPSVYIRLRPSKAHVREGDLNSGGSGHGSACRLVGLGLSSAGCGSSVGFAVVAFLSLFRRRWMARGRCFAASSSRRVMRSASVRALCHASSSREYLSMLSMYAVSSSIEWSQASAWGRVGWGGARGACRRARLVPGSGASCVGGCSVSLA